MLSEQHMNMITSVVMNAMENRICLLSFDISTAKVVIDNTGRTEEEVERLARELKVQLMLLVIAILSQPMEVKLKFKSVSSEEYEKVKVELVNKYKHLL